MNRDPIHPCRPTGFAAAASRGCAAPGRAALAALAVLLVAAPVQAQYSGPATSVFTVTHPGTGLIDQQTQHTSLRAPVTTSLVTVANHGGQGHRSFLVGLQLAEGGWVSFNIREGGDDFALPLTQPLRIRAISVRCDSFSDVRCRYQVAIVGNE